MPSGQLYIALHPDQTEQTSEVKHSPVLLRHLQSSGVTLFAIMQLLITWI